MTTGTEIRAVATTFDSLYREHYERIYRFACRMLGDADEASDLAQETFVKLHNALKHKTELERPRTWLYTVAANGCKNHLKRKAHYRDVISPQLSPDASQENAEEKMLREERARLMREAIKTLPDRDRILLMLYQDRLPYAEMAEVVGVKAGSVGKLLSRAIDRLVKASRKGVRP